MGIEEAKERLKNKLENDKGYLEKCNPFSDIVNEVIADNNAIETVLSELEKKEKTIELMAINLSSLGTGIEVIRKQLEKEYCEFINSDEDLCWKTDMECKDCIIQYFTNKVEKEGK